MGAQQHGLSDTAGRPGRQAMKYPLLPCCAGFQKRQSAVIKDPVKAHCPGGNSWGVRVGFCKSLSAPSPAAAEQGPRSTPSSALIGTSGGLSWHPARPPDTAQCLHNTWITLQ